MMGLRSKQKLAAAVPFVTLLGAKQRANPSGPGSQLNPWGVGLFGGGNPMARVNATNAIIGLLLVLMPGAVRSSGSTDLRLSVTPRNPEVLLGEPVVLVVTFTNAGNAEIRLPSPVEQVGWNQGLEVATRDESGQEHKVEPLMQVTATTPDRYLSLDPGSSLEVVWVIGGGHYQSNAPYTDPCGGDEYCWCLPAPGRYTIRVSYSEHWDSFWSGRIEATTQVVVVQPTEESKIAYEAWVEMRSAEGLALFGSHPWSQANGLEEFRNAVPLVAPDHPFWKSSYAPYAHHLFALTPFVHSERARELEQLPTKIPRLQDYVLYDEVLFELSDALRLDGRTEEAASVRDQLQSATPLSVHLFDYRTVGEGR